MRRTGRPSTVAALVAALLLVTFPQRASAASGAGAAAPTPQVALGIPLSAELATGLMVSDVLVTLEGTTR